MEERTCTGTCLPAPAPGEVASINSWATAITGAAAAVIYGPHRIDAMLCQRKNWDELPCLFRIGIGCPTDVIGAGVGSFLCCGLWII